MTDFESINCRCEASREMRLEVKFEDLNAFVTHSTAGVGRRDDPEFAMSGRAEEAPNTEASPRILKITSPNALQSIPIIDSESKSRSISQG